MHIYVLILNMIILRDGLYHSFLSKLLLRCSTEISCLPFLISRLSMQTWFYLHYTQLWDRIHLKHACNTDSKTLIKRLIYTWCPTCTGGGKTLRRAETHAGVQMRVSGVCVYQWEQHLYILYRSSSFSLAHWNLCLHHRKSTALIYTHT